MVNPLSVELSVFVYTHEVTSSKNPPLKVFTPQLSTIVMLSCFTTLIQSRLDHDI